MAVIGVYDSGIGGLTTVKLILNEFIGNDIYYFADNLHHPFGNTDEHKLKVVVSEGVRHIRAHSDVVVLACNTASSVTDESNVIKLLPPVHKYADDAENTLVMATARTLHKLSLCERYKIADTKELATLIEIQAGLNNIRGSLDMSELLPYLSEKLMPFKGVKRVILGCSHYLYCENEIRKILGDVEFVDGNENLQSELKKVITPNPLVPSKITFGFSSLNESKKYDKILKILMAQY